MNSAGATQFATIDDEKAWCAIFERHLKSTIEETGFPENFEITSYKSIEDFVVRYEKDDIDPPMLLILDKNLEEMDVSYRHIDQITGIMGGQNIRPCIGIGIDIGINRRNHQMHIHHRFHMGPKRLDRGGTKGQVRHKMPVHDINMHPICALRFDRANFCTKVGEISGQNGWCDFNGTVKGHVALLLHAATAEWVSSTQPPRSARF